MSAEHLERKLAAIFYIDLAGYRRLTGENEEGTHRRLSDYLDVITASVQRFFQVIYLLPWCYALNCDTQ